MSRDRRRRAAAVSILLLVAACGGGDDADPTNPPPPPPPPPPAQPTIAISAGDGQQAASAAPVAVAPAVLVRDAQGQPIAGATVQFAVTAGEQRLSATTGGVFEITTPGHPYEGLKLTVPSGTYAEPYWQITSISEADELLGDENEGSGTLHDLLKRVLATPAAGMIAIEPTGAGRTELQLRVRRAGTWSAADCCRPADPSAEWVMPLGVTPAATHQVGPFFAGWERDFWTQSSEDLGSGTMQGQQAFGLRTYDIEDAGSQVGPAGAARLTATRNGTTMTGTITLTVWWIDDETGQVSEPGEPFRLPFTAKRFR